MNPKPRSKKILYIVQHRHNRSGGQRFRCEQYIPYLKDAGFECEYAPILIDEQEDIDFYKNKNYFKKLILFLKGAYRRWQDVQRAKNFDVIFIYREAFMTGTTLFERMLKRSGAKVVFDFDDAIWNFDVSAGNKNLGWLKRPQKVNEIMAMADLILAGSSHLAAHAQQYNSRVQVIPSTLDMEKYTVASKCENKQAPIVIGWCGSITTLKHFEIILPVYSKLKQKFGSRIAFALYGLPGYINEALEIRSVDFSPETEVPFISSFDIGVMPLPDNEWTRGKCGMKGLQYMSLGIPAVMQAVGANCDIITDGENGYLATTEAEWIEKISLLIEKPELRQQLGANGRKTIEAHYSAQAIRHKYVQLFQELVTC